MKDESGCTAAVKTEDPPCLGFIIPGYFTP